MPQPAVRSNFDHRSQIPTSLFSGCKEPLVFIGIEILDDLIIRTEHPNFANRISVECALNITPVEERLEYAEIFFDSGFAVKRERNRTVRNRHVDQFDLVKSICTLTFMKQFLAAGRGWINAIFRAV
jgi:hypothetical protein